MALFASHGGINESQKKLTKDSMTAEITTFGDGIVKHQFSPYSDNGGNVVAIGGEGFAIIASDTRLSTGYQIMSRAQPKLFKLTNSAVLGTSGCWCDVLTFTRILDARVKMFRYEHGSSITTGAVAQLVANMLYSRRFFPYYISNIIAGLDESGNGVVYSYDPVGHCEKHTYRAGGSSAALIQPMLDNQVGKKNQQNVSAAEKKISKDVALRLIKDVFTSAAERDIYCGDGVLIRVITKDGTVEEHYNLRRD